MPCETSSPLDSLQIPMFRLLASPPADKKHFVVPGGHVPPRHLIIRETLAWLDRYLGPVTPARVKDAQGARE